MPDEATVAREIEQLRSMVDDRYEQETFAATGQMPKKKEEKEDAVEEVETSDENEEP